MYFKKTLKCLLLIFILTFSFNIKSLAGIHDEADEGGGGGGSSSCPNCKIKSNNDMPYGYRIYLVDANGNKLADTKTVNILNNWDSFYKNDHFKNKTYTLTKSATKKQFYDGGADDYYLKKIGVSSEKKTEVTIDGALWKKSPYSFNNCYTNKGNYFNRISAPLNLKTVSGKLIMAETSTSSTEASNKKKKQLFDNFFKKIGVNYTYDKMIKYLQANKNNRVYLKAEFIGGYYNDKRAFLGTPPELSYYAKNVLEAYDQNAPIVLYWRCAFQTVSGGGYHKVSLPSTTGKYIKWTSSEMKKYISRDKNDSKQYNGFGVYSIRIDEIVKNDCSALTEDQRCSKTWRDKTYVNSSGKKVACCPANDTCKYKSDTEKCTEKWRYQTYKDDNGKTVKCCPAIDTCKYKTPAEKCSDTWKNKTYKDDNGKTVKCCDTTIKSCKNLSKSERCNDTWKNKTYVDDKGKTVKCCNTTPSTCKNLSAEERCGTKWYNKTYTDNNGKTVNCCDCKSALNQSAVKAVQKGNPTTEQLSHYANLYNRIKSTEGKQLPVCDTTSSCNYDIDVSLPVNCEVSTSGHISDEVSWKCALNSTKEADNTVKTQYKYSYFENYYCSFYCKDEITYLMPDKGTFVDAGRYYVIGSYSGLQSNGPISFTKNTVCRSTSTDNPNKGLIDYDSFKKDYEDADKKVLEAWDNWQISIIKSELSGSNSKVYNNSFDKNITVTKSTSVDNVTKTKEAYDKAVTNRDKIIDNINMCNRFVKTDKEFEPVVNYTYAEKYYDSTHQLVVDSNTIDASVTVAANGTANDEDFTEAMTYDFTDSYLSSYKNKKYFAHDAGTYKTDTIKASNCGTSGTKQKCTNKQDKKYDNNPWIETSVTKTVTYKLKDGLYNYIDKGKGISVHNKPDSNYEYIGFSNLPIHFSTDAGVCPLNVKVTSFGDDKFNKTVIAGNGNVKFNNKAYYGDTNYKCTYDVYKSIDENNLVYRSISLIHPFLYQDGEEREPGENWSSSKNGVDFVGKYITNNRDVETSGVYDLDPMYEIELTPTLIKTIRKYNKDENKKPALMYNPNTKENEEAHEGYADYTLTCKDNGNASNKECTSSKIREWGATGCAMNESRDKYSKCSTTDAW